MSRFPRTIATEGGQGITQGETLRCDECGASTTDLEEAQGWLHVETKVLATGEPHLGWDFDTPEHLVAFFANRERPFIPRFSGGA